jgi:hypothetical protein
MTREKLYKVAVISKSTCSMTNRILECAIHAHAVVTEDRHLLTLKALLRGCEHDPAWPASWNFLRVQIGMIGRHLKVLAPMCAPSTASCTAVERLHFIGVPTSGQTITMDDIEEAVVSRLTHYR